MTLLAGGLAKRGGVPEEQELGMSLPSPPMPFPLYTAVAADTVIAGPVRPSDRQI